MARALDQSAASSFQKDSSNFDSVISLPKNSSNSIELHPAIIKTAEHSSSATEYTNKVQKKLKPTLSITFPDESPSESANTSPGVTSPSSDAIRKRRVSKQSSSEGLLNPIQENSPMNEETLSSTQHLRTGFFRTLKKQYPTAAFENLGLNDYSNDNGRRVELNVESPRNSNYSLENSSVSSSGTVQ